MRLFILTFLFAATAPALDLGWTAPTAGAYGSGFGTNRWVGGTILTNYWYPQYFEDSQAITVVQGSKRVPVAAPRCGER